MVSLSEMDVEATYQKLYEEYCVGFNDHPSYPFSAHFCIEIEAKCYYDESLFVRALNGIVGEMNSLLVFQFMIEIEMISAREHCGDILYACS